MSLRGGMATPLGGVRGKALAAVYVIAAIFLLKLAGLIEIVYVICSKVEKWKHRSGIHGRNPHVIS